MSSAEETLALIRTKVERAKEHIRDLEVEIRAFLATKPYEVSAKRDPQTRRLLYYVASVRETPIKIATVTGDVIQNLRSALDHLAYQLILVGGGTPDRRSAFPITDTDDPAQYKANRTGKVKGMRQDAIDAIDALNPYKGGNDTLWRIHKLNNIDKHRAVLTVGSAYNSFNAGAHMHRLWPPHIKEKFPVLPVLNVFLRPANRQFPLKQGNILFRDAPNAEVNEQMQFVFEVAFGEPQVIEGEPLLPTLVQMSDYVDNLIISFKPLLG
jgi:hypothetical protein